MHPEHWSLASRFSNEFGSTIKHLRRFAKAYLIGALAFVILVSTITWVRREAPPSDIPMLLVASVIHLLRAIAIVSLLFAWLGGQFVQEWLYARTSSSWTERESKRRPGVSFEVPHWRFYLPSVATRWLLVAAYIAALFFMLFVVPGWFPEVMQFIPDSFPF